MKCKKIFIGASSIVSLLLTATPAFAHVIVKPNEAGVAAFQTFTMGVPNEKENPTVAVRLIIPDGLKNVSPNVKLGWNIDIKKQGEGEEAKVTEIDWTGGSIPSSQRDEFIFSAQVPAQPTSLQWKAFQTYEDGSVVSWDQDPDSMKNLCDDQLFVKPTHAGRTFIETVDERPAYPGAKPYFYISGDLWEDRQWLTELIAKTAEELPTPKPRKKIRKN